MSSPACPVGSSSDEAIRKRDRGRGYAVPGARGEPGRFLAGPPADSRRTEATSPRCGRCLLLRQADPAAYEALPTTIWQKWAPVIVGLPRHGVVDNYPDAAGDDARRTGQGAGGVHRDRRDDDPRGKGARALGGRAPEQRLTVLHPSGPGRAAGTTKPSRPAIFQELTAPDLTSGRIRGTAECAARGGVRARDRACSRFPRSSRSRPAGDRQSPPRARAGPRLAGAVGQAYAG